MSDTTTAAPPEVYEGEMVPHNEGPYAPVHTLHPYAENRHLLVEGETPVVVTPVIPGLLARYTYQKGRFWAGSRTKWFVEDDRSPYWRTLHHCTPLRRFLQEDQTNGAVLYVVLPDYIQRMGVVPPEEHLVCCVDLLQGGLFQHYATARVATCWSGLPWPPELYLGKYGHDVIENLTETYHGGVVVRPTRETKSPSLRPSRVIFKATKEEG